MLRHPCAVLFQYSSILIYYVWQRAESNRLLLSPSKILLTSNYHTQTCHIPVHGDMLPGDRYAMLPNLIRFVTSRIKIIRQTLRMLYNVIVLCLSNCLNEVLRILNIILTYIKTVEGRFFMTGFINAKLLYISFQGSYIRKCIVLFSSSLRTWRRHCTALPHVILSRLCAISGGTPRLTAILLAAKNNWNQMARYWREPIVGCDIMQ